MEQYILLQHQGLSTNEVLPGLSQYIKTAKSKVEERNLTLLVTGFESHLKYSLPLKYPSYIIPNVTFDQYRKFYRLKKRVEEKKFRENVRKGVSHSQTQDATRLKVEEVINIFLPKSKTSFVPVFAFSRL